MKSPDEIKAEFTAEWVKKAESDYRTSALHGKSGEEFVGGVSFHAQQAAEKYLKAFLVWHQIEFTKTHDIEKLLSLAAQVDATLATELQPAKALTPYGVEYRYPNDYPDVTLPDADEALGLAKQVREYVRRRLPANIL